jgi:hypothetical protein
LDVNHKKVFEKSLLITSSFEGASWGGSNGNFDGMGVSAFILQWNLGQHTLQPLIIAMYQADIKSFKDLAKDKTQPLIDVCLSPDPETLQDFVLNITTGNRFVLPADKEGRYLNGGKQLKPEWKNTFASLGINFKEQQMNAAQKYFDNAIDECTRFKLNTERSIAFMFDFCVQRGKGNLSLEQKEFLTISKSPDYIEDDDTWLKHVLEEDLQNSIKSPWHQDSYSRRACILNDGGIVHGREYDLGLEFELGDSKIL